ncbi:MAG: hypothetical protein HQM14_01625 [SAR324 cluster bacterium]|nr:hypothetical protein [SAR324 cluster bacterium]
MSFRLFLKCIGFFLYVGLLLCLNTSKLCAQLSSNSALGFRAGNINIQNREQRNEITPLYSEINYHIGLPNNEGYEMVGQLGHGVFALQRRERSQDYLHEYQMTLVQLSFLANIRESFDIYYGAGGGGGYFKRRSKVLEGTLEGKRAPNSNGSFISYHVTLGMGYYGSGSGITLDFDYANWGGLFVVLGTLGYVF